MKQKFNFTREPVSADIRLDRLFSFTHLVLPCYIVCVGKVTVKMLTLHGPTVTRS